MLVVLVQAAAAWFMVGTVATMQVLNYPLMARVGADSFVDYERAHNRRFGIVVGPGVLVVVVATVVLLVAPPEGLGRTLPVLSAVTVAVVAALTALFQAPAHRRLAEGFDPEVHARLVRSNAWRAVAWAVLGVLDLLMLALVAA